MHCIITLLSNLFQSTLPCGSDQCFVQHMQAVFAFQSTLPCGSDFNVLVPKLRQHISIHAPLRERLCRKWRWIWKRHFNPRSLAGATDFYWPSFAHLGISIHAPLRERQAAEMIQGVWINISIHAPLRERLHLNNKRVSIYADFNPRSLAGATLLLLIHSRFFQFQSKLPCGSDTLNIILANILQNFNPRSLAGATEPDE